MNKTGLIRIAVILLISGWAVNPPLATAAEAIPPLATIPALVSDAERGRLTQQQRELVFQYATFLAAANTFNGKPAKDQTDEEFAAVQTQRNQYIQAAKAFNQKVAEDLAALDDCDRLAAQLESDKHALELQKKTNEMGYQEIEEWAKANDEAQKGALAAGAKLLLSGLGEKLKEQANSASKFKGWLTRYEKAITDQGVPYAALQAKIESATRGYLNASVQAAAGTAIGAGSSVYDAWDLAKKEAASVAESQSAADASMRDILNNPQIQKILSTDQASTEFSQAFVGMAAHSQELNKLIGPEADLASFVVDYGYEATKWVQSRNRIIQQYDLSDKELLAVAALKQQIETTVKQLNACKARHQSEPKVTAAGM